MSLQVEADIFKWLQTYKIVKDGKRTANNAVQLAPQIANKFFDGLYISQIVKIILKDQGDEESAAKLDAIKQNSTPAIRLYNWNILTEILKKLKYNLDYSEKSKILNLDPEIILKLLNFLFALKNQKVEQEIKKKLSVDTLSIGKKKLEEGSNIFQFLVISICKHFKLSVQHTLNLFLDNNKYLAHLLVKGVKNEYGPIYLLLEDIDTHLEFIVVKLFCVDEQESLTFLLNALKPCFISKDTPTAEKSLKILKNIYDTYIQTNADLKFAKKWMISEGTNTLLFGLKRHPTLFELIIEVCYAYLDWQFFPFFDPIQKSIIWVNQIEKLSFYKQFLMDSPQSLLNKFMTSNSFSLWNKYCQKSLKKLKNTQQLIELMNIFERIWTYSDQSFQADENGLPNAFLLFLKNGSLSQSQIFFTQSIRTLFSLMVFLGKKKNSYAPFLYKTLVNCLTFQQNVNRISFICYNFEEAFKSISNLPGSPIFQALMKSLQRVITLPSLSLCKTLLEQKRLSATEGADLAQMLAKIAFFNVEFGKLAIDYIFIYLKGIDNDLIDELLQKNGKLGLSLMYSSCLQINRSLFDLKSDFKRYGEEESMRRGEPTFIRNMTKYQLISNILTFLKRSIQFNAKTKNQSEPLIFHTYVKIKHQLKKMYLADLLLPLMRMYEDDDDELKIKIKTYEDEAYPKIQPISKSKSMDVSTLEQRRPSLNQSQRQNTVIKSQKSEPVSPFKATEGAIKQLERIKKKREELKSMEIVKQKERDLIQQKKQLYRSLVNEKRVVQFGIKNANDLEYKCIFEFDTVKKQQNLLGLPNVKYFKIDLQEQEPFIEDFDSLMRKYRKIWRFLFFKYSSCGPLKQQAKVEQKINIAQLWKLLKEYQIQIVKKQESHTFVRKINQNMKRRNDLQNLTYLGFEEYILQICNYGYDRMGYAHIPPSKKILMLLNQIKKITGEKGGSTQIFDNPQEVYFQQTEVIKEFNRRLKENPQYILPEGYKKVKQTELIYEHEVSQKNKLNLKIKQSYFEVLEVLDMIFSQREELGFHLIEPTTTKQEKCLAKPALFQKLNQKLKEYKGGYLLPKRQINSTYIQNRGKIVAAVKPEFHPLINFSLGIKIGLASVDIKNRYIADEVAYWMDDMLDAVVDGKLVVENKAKRKIQNEALRRKRASVAKAYAEKRDYQKKYKSRSQTVKHEAQKYRQHVQQDLVKKRQAEKQQRKERKEKEQRQIKKKLQEFELAKAELNKKRDEEKRKKLQQLENKHKQKEEYKKGVEEYFKKKKLELEEAEKNMKSNKEFQIKKEEQNKKKEVNFRKKLQIQIYKQDQAILEKVIEKKQSYEESWKSSMIQNQFAVHRQSLKFLFDLLLKLEKSKISGTNFQQIGLPTLNFFALKFKIVPFMIDKNDLLFMFKSMRIQQQPSKVQLGLTFKAFQQILFRIIIKAKNLLNNAIKKRQQQKSMSLSNIAKIQGQQYESQSPQNTEKKKEKKKLSDDYLLDVQGVTDATVRKFIQFLNLPQDKAGVEQRFKELVQSRGVKPTSLLIKQLKNTFA